MIDLSWKDIALALLGVSWAGVCCWCRRIQKHADATDRELSHIREKLPLHYVLKTDNSEALKRIEEKIDRLVERMLP